MNMKLLPRLLSIFFLASGSLFFTNCDDESDSKTAEETQLLKLKGKWSLVSATKDGNDMPYFRNIILILEGNYMGEGLSYKYYFENGGELVDPSPWPKAHSEAKGRWKFGSNPETTIIRMEDEVSMNYSFSADGQTLTLQFTCSTCEYEGGPTNPPGGRSKNISGSWTMVFSKI